jgi:non-ribosomal peptide synthetase component F
MTKWIYTMVFVDVFKRNDIIGQISRSSFDLHALDIIGILIIGGTLIMFRPEGILDFVYLAAVFKTKQITYIQTVPSLLQSFFTFLTETHNSMDVICLRSLCTCGEWR